jgi:hypothetical protein
MLRVCWLSVILFYSSHAWCQLDNTVLTDRFATSKGDTAKLGIALHYQPFMRNTEYFNTIELGRTLFGHQLMPIAYVQPHPQLRLQLGFFAQQDFGSKPSVNRILPITSLIISNKNHDTRFIFGTIEGALSHQLIEPLFDIASAITNRIEYGAQFKTERARYFIDSWINWQQFIEPGSPFKEQFTAGVHTNYNLLKPISRTSIKPIFQSTMFHRGGQIDSDTTPMVMLIHTSFGVKLIHMLRGRSSTYIGADAYLLNYINRNFSYLQPAVNGNGLFANLYAGIDNIHFVFSYWKGNNWYNPTGTFIYQSFANDPLTKSFIERQLLIPRLEYRKTVFDNLLMFSLRYEPVVELQSTLGVQHAFSCYLRCKIIK